MAAIEAIDGTLFAFLALVGLGAYVQAVTGFAMGMIVVALASVVALQPVPVVAAVVTPIVLLNVIVSLVGHTGQIKWPALWPMVIGQLPGTLAGLALLVLLEANAELVLSILLGVFLVAASASLMLRPQPGRVADGAVGLTATGVIGGVLNGLFAAGGPAVGWQLYRQPWPVAEIRATLLGYFGFSQVVRLAGVIAIEVTWLSAPEPVGAIAGPRSYGDVIVWLTLWSLPVAWLFSWWGSRFPPPLAELTLRRVAFGLMMAAGMLILVRAVVVGTDG